MRLTVQQLLPSAAALDRAPHGSQCAVEQFPPRVSKLRSLRTVANEQLRLRDSIREVRRKQIDVTHAGV
jgi:hypothetical protein